MEQKPVFAMKGLQDELLIFEDKLTITPKGVLGFLNKGLQGTKSIPFSSITAVQYKKAGDIVSGYLQFSIFGGRESTGGIFAAATDENSFVFSGASSNEFAEKIKDYIEDKIKAGKSSSAPSVSSADELAKHFGLKEKGIISEEEFNKAKNKLLGI
jgi:hypothetical protein